MSLLFAAFCAFLCRLTFAADPVFDAAASSLTLAPGGSGKVVVTLGIPEGYHIFRDALTVETVDPAGLQVGAPSLPPGEPTPDPVNPGLTVESYEQMVAVDVPVSAPATLGPGSRQVALKLTFRACKATLCLAGQERVVSAPVVIGPKSASRGLLPAALGLLVPTALAGPEDEVAVIFTGKAAGPDQVTVHVDLQGEWHLNKAFMGLTAPADGGFTMAEPAWPAAHPSGSKDDGTFREDFVEDFAVTVPVSGAAGERKVKVEVSFQACKGVLLCRMPTTELVEVPVSFTGAALPVAAAPGAAAPDAAAAPVDAAPAVAEALPTVPPGTPATPAAKAESGGLFGELEAAKEQSVLMLVALCFMAGIGVSFTPCVLPMVPITLGLIGAKNDPTLLGRLSRTLTYVAGLAIVYTGLGVFAGTSGALFGSWLQEPMVIRAIQLLFFVLGGGMIGWYELQLPSGLTSRLQGSVSGASGFVGAFLLGAVGALVAGPCSGPVIVWILTLIGQGGQTGLGAGLMLAFSIGMGMIFIVAGIATHMLPKRGPWMIVVKKSFGVMIWLAAIYFGRSLDDAWVLALVTAAILLSTAVFAWPDPDEGEGVTVQRARQLYSVAGGLVGAYLLLGTLLTQGLILPPMRLSQAATGGGGAAATAQAIPWMAEEAAGVARARADRKPMMIDFTADWCAACKEMEHYTYSDARVVEAAKGFVPVMVDCTEKSDPVVIEVQKKYGVLGLPTVVFVDADGVVVDRTIGFVKADDFLPKMQALLGTDA